MCDSNRWDFRHTKINDKFSQRVQLPNRDLNGHYTPVWVRQLKSGVQWGEGSTRKQWACALWGRQTIHNVSTSLTGLPGSRHDLTYAKCLQRCLARSSKCSIAVSCYYDVPLCTAPCCVTVCRAPWRFLESFWPFYLQQTLVSVFNLMPQVVVRLRSEMTKMNQGVCPWSDGKRETPPPHLPISERQRAGAGGRLARRAAGTQSRAPLPAGVRWAGEGFVDAWRWRKSLEKSRPGNTIKGHP